MTMGGGAGNYLQQQWADDDAVYNAAGWGNNAPGASAAHDPGPWLQRTVIGYLILVVGLLYPVTIAVRRGRKHRKRRAAASRKAGRPEASKAKDTCTPTKARLLPGGGGGTPDTSLLNTSLESEERRPAYESPTIPRRRDQDADSRLIDLDDSFDNDDDDNDDANHHGAVTIEMGILGQELEEAGHMDAIARSSASGADDGSAYVSVALPPHETPDADGLAAKHSTSGINLNQNTENDLRHETDAVGDPGHQQQKRRSSLRDAASMFRGRSRSRSVTRNRSRSPVNGNDQARRSRSRSRSFSRERLSKAASSVMGGTVIKSQRHPRVVLLASGTEGNEDGQITAKTPVDANAMRSERLANFSVFGHRGARRRKIIISTQLATKSRPQPTNGPTAGNLDVFFLKQEEKNKAMMGNVLQRAFGCGFEHVEIDDESLHGDQVGNVLYSSHDNDISDDDEDDVVEYGAYDDFAWADLSPVIKEAAEILGYCQSSWDGGEHVATTGKLWVDLSSEERTAAIHLGYNESFWNNGTPHTIDTCQLNTPIRGKDTLRAVLRLDSESRAIALDAVPATIENMFGTVLDAVEIAIISKFIGWEALTVYGVVDLALSLTSILGYGISGAEEVLVSQAIGSGDYYQAGATTQISVILYLLVSIPSYLFWGIFIDDLILYLGLGQKIAQMAQAYMPIMALHSFIYNGFSSTLGGLMRIDGKTWQISIIDAVFTGLHVGAVAICIVKYDFKLVQVAWLELISSTTYGLFMFGFCSITGWLNPFKKGLYDLRGIRNGQLIQNLVKLAIPTCLSELLASGEWHLLTLFAAYIGDVAAWTVAGAVWEVFELAPEGISSAAVIRIGYHLGQADPRKAKLAAYKCLVGGVVWAAILTAIFVWQSDFIIKSFTDDDYIVNALEDVVVMIGAGNVVMCVGNLAWSILTIQSRSKIPAWTYGAVGVLGTCLPLASFFTFKMHLSIAGLVAAVVISYSTVSMFLLVFVFTSNWTKLCCRIISATSGFVFEAIDDEEKGRQWKLSNPPGPLGARGSPTDKQSESTKPKFELDKEISLTSWA